MQLIGRNLSPFVRRSATVLNLLGLEYEQKAVSTIDDADTIKRFNPLGRVPALQDDTVVVVDSHAIIDYALEHAEHAGALLAAGGLSRQQTLYLSSVAVGCMEKGVASAYEASQRPKEHFYPPYQDKLRGQVIDGLHHLNDRLGESAWFGGDAPTLADVDAVVAWDFFGIVAPAVQAQLELNHLARLADQANQTPAFTTTRWQG